MWNPPNPKAYFAIVWHIVRQVPAGRVTTYGQIASMIPPPAGTDPEQYARLGARWVGTAMRKTPDDTVPWHRVINSQGKISLPAGSETAEAQHHLLEAEGIIFDASGKVDLSEFGWEGPDFGWLEENDLYEPKPLS